MLKNFSKKTTAPPAPLSFSCHQSTHDEKRAHYKRCTPLRLRNLAERTAQMTLARAARLPLPNHHYPKQKDFTLQALRRIMLYAIHPANYQPPDTSFKEGLKALMKSCPLKQEKEMGFSEEWRSDPFWK